MLPTIIVILWVFLVFGACVPAIGRWQWMCFSNARFWAEERLETLLEHNPFHRNK